MLDGVREYLVASSPFLKGLTRADFAETSNDATAPDGVDATGRQGNSEDKAPSGVINVDDDIVVARESLPVEVDVMKLLLKSPELGSLLCTSNTASTEPHPLLRVIISEFYYLARVWWKKFGGGESAAILGQDLVAHEEAKGRIRVAIRNGGENITIRPVHLPSSLYCDRLGAQHIGRIVLLSGTMVRLSAKKLVPYTKQFQCPKCKTVTSQSSVPSDRSAMLRGTCSQRNCRGQMLTEKDTVWMDYCEGRLQQTTKTGHLPRSVTVVMDDELTEKISVGSAVEVVGLVLIRWRGLGRTSGSTLNAEQVVYALNVYREDVAATRANLDSNQASYGAGKRGQPDEEAAESKAELLRGMRFGKGSSTVTGREAMDPRTAAFLRTLLVQSVCPQLSGTFGPRLGLLLAAIGGVAYCVDGIRVRGTTHALFVGDPGTGKSQLLKYAAAMAPRSVFAAGMTSTTAGLTVAAVKEFGEWTLEPGALVLADGGVCAIDELRTVSAADRTALHEAMEQQTISVAKAGLVTRLRTETSVIAACNPQRKTDNALEIGVGGPLLSRFDLLFFMWDDRRHDDVVAAHILQCSSKRSVRPPFSIPEMKLFVRDVNGEYLNDRNGPHLDEGAVSLISRYYAFQRRVSNDCAGSERDIRTLSGKLPVTVRFLESLVRFTLAHVKLRGGHRSSDLDAALAILLMELTAHSLKIEFRRGNVTLNSLEVERVFLNEAAIEEQVAWLRVIADRIGLLELPADELDMMRSQLSVQQDYSSRKRARPTDDAGEPSDPWLGDLSAGVLNSSPSPVDGRSVGLDFHERGTGKDLSNPRHHAHKSTTGDGIKFGVSDPRPMNVHEWNEMHTIHAGSGWATTDRDTTTRTVIEKLPSSVLPDAPRPTSVPAGGHATDPSPPTTALSQGFHLSLTPVTTWDFPLDVPVPVSSVQPEVTQDPPVSSVGPARTETLAERIKRLKQSSG